MSFADDLKRWTAKAIRKSGPDMGRRIDRLLRGDEGSLLDPYGERNPLDPERRQVVPPAFEQESAIAPGTWIFYPVSDDAPYSWGDPYSTTLGTPLAGVPCATGLLRTIEASKHPYRLYDGDADQLSHGTTLMAGRHYWKHDDYLITWGPCMGFESTSEQFTDNTERWVYRNGQKLAKTRQVSFDNPYEIRGAAIRHIAGTNYLYIISNGVGTGTYFTNNLIQRAVIDPYGQNQSPTWQSSPGVDAALQGLTPPFHTTSFDGGTTWLLPCSFNKSCTRVLICQPGRVVELDITTWGSEFVVSDTYFGDSFVLPPDATSPGHGIMPILSAYEADSDTRRDLTVRIDNTGDPNWTGIGSLINYRARATATLRENDTDIETYLLYDVEPINEQPYWEMAFLTINPYYQDLQGRIYCVDHHRAYRKEDWQNEAGGRPWRKRYHNFEIWRGTEQIEFHQIVEEIPVPDPVQNTDYDQFTRSGAFSVRDASGYPQYGITGQNRLWLWFINEQWLTWICGEIVGNNLALPSSGNHWVSDDTLSMTSNVVSYDNGATSYFYDRMNNWAFASDWNGSYISSRRFFKDWSQHPVPTYEWWNVGTVDLLDKVGATGPEQRLMADGCVSNPKFLRNDWNHIGLYRSSSDQPFPP